MKKIIFGLLACSLPMIANAQAAFDALQMSQSELRGTARSEAMAGAFGALGGDLSTLVQNPAGVGVYRSSDAGITFNLDFNSTETPGQATLDKTRFNVANVGYVGTVKLNSDVMPYFNFGFSYSRKADLKRHYKGGGSGIPSSVSNYIAGYTGNYTPADLAAGESNYNPYYDSSAPWSSILAYNSYIINDNNGTWQGLMGDGTSGYGEYEVDQRGHIDEYSINIGGNINNLLYWGAAVGITDFDYDSYMYYGESLQDAYIYDYVKGDGTIKRGPADYGFENYLSTDGTGYNFKLGVILKPVNELRLGLAFHTPTYYDMRDIYAANASFQMGTGDESYYGTNYAGSGQDRLGDVFHYNYHTPWRVLASVAGVIGRSGILSFDYEWVGANTMRLGDDNGDEWPDVTQNIKDYFQAQHIFRVGGEYRITPNWSVRAGYSYTTSPVKDEVKDDQMNIMTTSSNPAYEFDKSIQYITAGFGYRYKSVYFDMAYVHKTRKSVYHAFAPVVYDGGIEPAVWSEVNDNNNRITATIGFRF